MEHNSYLSVDILESYDLFLRRKRLALLILLSVLAALMLFAAASGSSGITVSQVLETVLGRGTTQTEAIVFRVRLPRVMTAVAVGAALALSGCIMQNVLHNPLASASTLGVSKARPSARPWPSSRSTPVFRTRPTPGPPLPSAPPAR